MNNIIPSTVRREILCLDMHDVPIEEIARQTNVKCSTVSAIINRARDWTKEQWRGNVVLLYDPTGIFKSGARFNLPDLESMVELSDLADGTVFEIPRCDGSVHRAEIQEGQLELWQK